MIKSSSLRRFGDEICPGWSEMSDSVAGMFYSEVEQMFGPGPGLVETCPPH